MANHSNSPKAAPPLRLLAGAGGNILAYIVMTMVIFAFLGVTMVSLFSTSIGSSATPNAARRAFIIFESGIRYAISEIRGNNFATTAINTLNNLTYNVVQGGTFRLNVFSPWFEAITTFDTSINGSTISARVPEGQIPQGYAVGLPANNPNFFLVNHNYIDITQPPRPGATAFAQITQVNAATTTQLNFVLGDDFVARHDDKIVLAVAPASGTQTIPTQGHIDLSPSARFIFHQNGGSFEVQKRSFYFTGRDDTETRTRLLGVAPVENENTLPSIDVNSGDLIILSPRNRLVISEGKFGDVTYGGTLDYAVPIADTSFVSPEQLKPDIEFEEEANLSGSLNRRATVSAGQSYARVSDTNHTLGFENLSGSGAIWYRDNRIVGGERNYCLNGECLFNNGIRVFFVLNYSGSDGDGFTFSVINGANNSFGAVGGDIALSELLAYAGDSRLIANPINPVTDFLDGSGQGIRSPKMAVEFDGFTNNVNSDICADSSTINTNTRYDPAGNIDRVQFVFWGVNFEDYYPPCRSYLGSNHTSLYDDNKHNSDRFLSPPNYREQSLTPTRLNATGLSDNWLTQGPWAVRIEIERASTTGDYAMKAWMIRCGGSGDCTDIPPFYRNTRYKYNWSLPPSIPVLEQTFNLASSLNSDFERILFGFTSATSSFQQIIISKFQLSFIRSNDPTARD